MKNHDGVSVLESSSKLHFCNANISNDDSKLSSRQVKTGFRYSSFTEILKQSSDESLKSIVIYLNCLRKWKKLKKRNKTRQQQSFLTSPKRIVDCTISEQILGSKISWVVSYAFNTGEVWKHEFFDKNEAFSCMGAYGTQRPRTPRQQIKEIFGGGNHV